MARSRRTALYLITTSFWMVLDCSPTVASHRHAHPFPEAASITRRCKGCSCKCGPGFRLPGHNCANWDQHWKFTKKGYPAGTVDEIDLPTTQHHHLCPPEVIK